MSAPHVQIGIASSQSGLCYADSLINALVTFDAFQHCLVSLSYLNSEPVSQLSLHRCLTLSGAQWLAELLTLITDVGHGECVQCTGLIKLLDVPLNQQQDPMDFASRMLGKSAKSMHDFAAAFDVQF